MAFRTPKPRTSSIPPLPNTSLAAPSTLPRSPVTSSKLAAAGAREESERLWNRTRVLEAELASRNVELGKFAPKLAAAETALARAKANAQLASESQADLRASFNAGLASLSSTLLAARRELHYLSALSPSTLLPPPPLTSAVVSLGEDVDSPAGSLKGNSSKTHPKESLQSPPQSPTLPQGVRERSVNSSTENESCSQPHRAQTQELVRFTRQLLACVSNEVDTMHVPLSKSCRPRPSLLLSQTHGASNTSGDNASAAGVSSPKLRARAAASEDSQLSEALLRTKRAEEQVSELQRELTNLGEQRRVDREGKTTALKKVKALERDLAMATSGSGNGNGSGGGGSGGGGSGGGGSGVGRAVTSPTSPTSPASPSSSSAPMSPLSPGTGSSNTSGNLCSGVDTRNIDELRRALKAMEAQRDKALRKCESAQEDAATSSRVASKARAHLEDATAIKVGNDSSQREALSLAEARVRELEQEVKELTVENTSLKNQLSERDKELQRLRAISTEDRQVKASDSSEGPNAPSSSSPLASTDNAPPLSPSGDQAPPPSQPDTESCSPTNEEEEEEDSDATSGKKRSSKKTSNSNRDKKGNSSNDNSSSGSGMAPLKSSHKNITSRATSRRLNLASDSP